MRWSGKEDLALATGVGGMLAFTNKTVLTHIGAAHYGQPRVLISKEVLKVGCQ